MDLEGFSQRPEYYVVPELNIKVHESNPQSSSSRCTYPTLEIGIVICRKPK